MSHDFLTPPEVCKLLRVRPSKVLAWIRSGRLPAIDVSDGRRPRYRIRRADLDDFLQRRAVAPPIPTRRKRLDIPQYV